MKTKYRGWRAILFCLTLLFLQSVYSDDPFKNATCDMIGSDSAQSTIRYGGKFIPSSGVLRVLVVFVRFKDDTIEQSSTVLKLLFPVTVYYGTHGRYFD